MMMAQHQQEPLTGAEMVNMAAAFVVLAYFAFLLVTNQRLVVYTGNSVQISPQQNITEYSVHMGTAFIAALVLVPRLSMTCGQMLCSN